MDPRLAMHRFMDLSGDWTAKTQVDEEFRNLRDACREFAKFQYNMREKQSKRRVAGPPG